MCTHVAQADFSAAQSQSLLILLLNTHTDSRTVYFLLTGAAPAMVASTVVGSFVEISFSSCGEV